MLPHDLASAIHSPPPPNAPRARWGSFAPVPDFVLMNRLRLVNPIESNQDCDKPNSQSEYRAIGFSSLDRRSSALAPAPPLIAPARSGGAG